MVDTKKTKLASQLEQREKSEYKKYLEELEDPNYQGGSWFLPENPTYLEQAKYDVCQNIIRYKRINNLSTKEIAKKIKLSLGETEDILYCRFEHFTLDRLVAWASCLPLEIKIVVENKKESKARHARAV